MSSADECREKAKGLVQQAQGAKSHSVSSYWTLHKNGWRLLTRLKPPRSFTATKRADATARLHPPKTAHSIASPAGPFRQASVAESGRAPA